MSVPMNEVGREISEAQAEEIRRALQEGLSKQQVEIKERAENQENSNNDGLSTPSKIQHRSSIADLDEQRKEQHRNALILRRLELQQLQQQAQLQAEQAAEEGYNQDEQDEEVQGTARRLAYPQVQKLSRPYPRS